MLYVIISISGEIDCIIIDFSFFIEGKTVLDRDYHASLNILREELRVAIARALVTNPKLIVTDEPTGNLDSKNSHELLELFKKLNAEEGVSILMVTHDTMIASYSSKLLYIQDGIIATTLERGNLSQKEYFYKIVDINSNESQKLFVD